MTSEYKVKQRTIRNDFSLSQPIKRHQMKLADGRFKIKKSEYLFSPAHSRYKTEPQVVLQTTKCTGFKKKLRKNKGSKIHPLNVDTKYENTTADSENPWAIGHWQLLDQYWGIMIRVSSSLRFPLQKAGQGEAGYFSNKKSKHFTACLLPHAHWGFWDNTGCCPCFHARQSLRGSYSTWAPPQGLSPCAEMTRLHSWMLDLTKLPGAAPTQPLPVLAALAAVNSSRTKQPRRQRQQWWLHWPQHDHILQVTPLGSTWAPRGAPVWYFVTLSFPELESSQCLWIRDSQAWTFSTELSFSVIMLLRVWPLSNHATAFPVLLWAECPHLVSI